MSAPDADELIRQIQRAMEERNHVLALALMDQLAAMDPENPDMPWWRAHTLLAQGQAQEAMEEARQAVDVAPESPDAHRMMAVAAWHMERLPLAQQSFERALRLSGEDSMILSEYAMFMACERGPELAERTTRRALSADPRSPNAWTALGVIHMRRWRYAEARAALERALELRPDHTSAQMYMTMLMDMTGKRDKSRALRRLLEDKPQARPLVEYLQKRETEGHFSDRLMDRPEVRRAVQEGRARSRRRRAALGRLGWVIGAAAGVVGLLVLRPWTPGGLVRTIIVGASVLLFLYLWRFATRGASERE